MVSEFGLSTEGQTTVTFPSDTPYVVKSAALGGMGVVYFCRDQDGTPLVLKTFRDELLLKRVDRVRFMQEVCDWISLGSHPHIVQALRVETWGYPTKPYLVLEAIEGSQLGDDVSLNNILSKIQSHQLPIKASLKIALGVCRAMAYACRVIPGLVHRDIKPANILIDPQGNARLTDFGVASSGEKIFELSDEQIKKLEQGTKQSFKPAGSPHYIAPEQWSPRNIDAHITVDIYAFGLTLYEILTGFRRVQGSTWEELQDVHVQNKLLRIPETMPAELVTLINTCCAMDATKRYQDWHELEQALCTSYAELISEPAPILSKVSKANNSLENLYISNSAIAQSYQSLGLIDIAEQYNEQALKQARALDDKKRIFKTILIQCELNFLNGAAEQACTMLSDAISDYEKIATIHEEMKLANYLAECGKFTESIHLLEELQQQSNNDKKLQQLLYGNLANVYALQGEHNKAIDLYRQQCEFFIVQKDTVNEVNCKSNMATALFDSGDYKKAIEVLISCYKLSEQVGEIFGLTHAYKHLYLAYKEIGNTEKSLEHLITYRNHVREWGDQAELSWAEQEHAKFARSFDL